MISRIQSIAWLPIIGILILAIVLFSPEFLGINYWMNLSVRMNLLLTAAITVFAALEGYSTYMQVELQNERNLIKDTKSEWFYEG